MVDMFEESVELSDNRPGMQPSGMNRAAMLLPGKSHVTHRAECLPVKASKSSSAVSPQLQKVDSPVTTPPHHPPPSSYDMIGTVQAACNVRIVIERSIIS